MNLLAVRENRVCERDSGAAADISSHVNQRGGLVGLALRQSGIGRRQDRDEYERQSLRRDNHTGQLILRLFRDDPIEQLVVWRSPEYSGLDDPLACARLGLA